MSSLEILSLPQSFKNFQEGWCECLYNLTKIYISNQNKKFVFLDDKILLSKSIDPLDYYDVIIFSSRNITEITIPSSIMQISEYAFANCSQLKIVLFNEDSQLSTLSRSSFLSSFIERISIPLSVTEINDFAFTSCTNLKEVNFKVNSKLNSIGNFSFSGTSINGIKIPNSVTRIGKCAFKNCLLLKSIEFEPESKTILD